MYDRSHASRGQQRPHVLPHRTCNSGLLLDTARAQCRADQREALEHEHIHLDLGPAASLDRDDDDPAVNGCNFDVTLNIGCRDNVQYDIRSPSAGRVLDDLHKIFGAVVDPPYGTKVLTYARLRVRSGCSEHLRSPSRRELNRRRADPAGSSVNEHGIASLAAAALEHVGPDGQERLWYRG